MNGPGPRPLALLGPTDVIPYLASRGLDPGTDAEVTPLTDGVSARVYLVGGEHCRFVLKQALPELLVEEHWGADPRRALTEAAALTLAHRLTPENVPVLLDSDPDACALVMTAAPAEWANWRSVLLAPGSAPDPALVARDLGRILGTWHRATWGGREALPFEDEAFEQLRLTPFHRAVLGIHPGLRGSLGTCLEDLLTRNDCLVHGDFSPKNVLVGSGGIWVLDFEVTRPGAAVFDAAFLGHHLALKAVARPDRAAALRGAFGGFLRSYSEALGRTPALPHLGWHTAALMLSRVDGVSRARYLSPSQAAAVRGISTVALASDDPSWETLWDLVPGARAGGAR